MTERSLPMSLEFRRRSQRRVAILRDARIGPGTLRTALPELDRAQSVAAVVEDFRGRIEGFRDRTGLFERAVTSEGTAIDCVHPARTRPGLWESTT